MEVVIAAPDELAGLAADAIEQLLAAKPTAVLGLATGSSPLGIYDELVRRLGIADSAPDRNDPAAFPALRELITETVRGRSLAEWTEVFDDSDACVAPVLPLSEAVRHPHVVARGVYVERDGAAEPAPAPRFSRTGASLTTPPAATPGQHTREALTAWGIADVDGLLASGAAVQA